MVNELEGDEVSVVTRSVEAGTKAVLLSKTFNYSERSQVYKNGELWLAHCDGKSESEIDQQTGMEHQACLASG